MTRTTRVGTDRRAARRLSAADVRLHALLVIGVPVCIAAGWFELDRALAGRDVAWVYAFEWPLFGIYGVYIWWRLYRERRSTTTGPSNSATGGRSSGVEGDSVVLSGSRRGDAQPQRSDDPQLAEWEHYLRRLHSVDPPGEPPRSGKAG